MSFYPQHKNFLGADVVVQINSSYETMCLYRELSDKGMTYVQDMGGYMVTVGKVDGRPICITPMIHTIDGVKVLYIEATSQLVDWLMIENWIKSMIKDGVRILSEPGNLLGEVRSISKDIREGNLKKHVLVHKRECTGLEAFVQDEKPRYIKSIEFNVNGRNHITTTTNQFEALYDSPAKLEEMIKQLHVYMAPITDGKEDGFHIYDQY